MNRAVFPQMAESEWKCFRKLREKVLERYCSRVLQDVQSIASNGTETNHERFLAISRLLDQRNSNMAKAFDNPRRSVGLIQLGYMAGLGLLEDEDLAMFGPETRKFIDMVHSPARDS